MISFKESLPIIQYGEVIGGIGINSLNEDDDEALVGETRVSLAQTLGGPIPYPARHSFMAEWAYLR